MKKHRQLRNLDYSTSHFETETHAAPTDTFGASKTTEVLVTSEVIDQDTIDLAPLGRRDSEAAPGPKAPNAAAYSVTISSNKRTENPESHREFNLPIHSDAATVQVAAPAQRPAAAAANRTRHRVAYEANSAAWSYAKVAILFFTAMLVTWIPSSANRVFSVVHPGKTSTPLEYMSALVLPLQGLWNGLIYAVTSWKPCKMLWRDIWRGRSNRPPRPPPEFADGFRARNSSFTRIASGRNGSNSSGKSAYESESMTELAMDSRPSSRENNKRPS